MGSCQGNCFHQKICSLLFQRPGSRQQPQIFRSGQFRLGCRFRLQLSGQLQIPAAQVVQQAVSGGDVCVHCGRGISLCQQSLPPCLQSIQDDLLVRRQIVVECLQFCGVKPHGLFPAPSVIQILQIGPDALFTYRYTDCFQRCCRLLTHRACSLHCSSPYQRNQHFEYVRGQSKTWSA